MAKAKRRTDNLPPLADPIYKGDPDERWPLDFPSDEAGKLTERACFARAERWGNKHHPDWGVPEAGGVWADEFSCTFTNYQTIAIDRTTGDCWFVPVHMADMAWRWEA